MLENYQTSHISKRIIVFFRSPKDLFRFSKYISISGDFGYALGKFTKFPVSDPEIYILVNITELETNNNINSKKCAIKIPLPQQVTVTSDDK